MLSLIAALLSATQDPPTERAFLMQAEHMARMEIRSLTLDGVDRRDRLPMTVSVEFPAADRTHFTISAESQAVGRGSLRLPRNDYPSLDLSSAVIFADDYHGRPAIVANIKYGESRDCFYDDDGRNRLVVVFEPEGTVEAVERTFVNCTPAIRNLSGSSTR